MFSLYLLLQQLEAVIDSEDTLEKNKANVS
jgi:hypothetical protein